MTDLIPSTQRLPWYSRVGYNLQRSEYGYVIEYYMSGKTIQQCCNQFGIDVDSFNYIISLYYKKPEYNMVLGSRV